MGEVDERTAGGGVEPRPLFVFLLFALLSVAMTWPLAPRAADALLNTDSNALNDSYFSVWIFGWQAHQLVVDPLHVFSGNIFFPFANTLAFSEIILPEALFYLPLAAATANPILAYNLVVLATFALNGFAMYLWALDVLPREGRGRSAAAILAGLVFSFSAYKIGEIRHVQLLATQWMPLTMLYLGRALRRPGARNGLLAGLFFSLNALSSLYYAVFLALAVLIYIIVDLGVRRYRPTREHLIYGAAACVLVAVLVAPLLVPFVQLEQVYHFSSGRDPRLFAARPASYVASPAANWLYGSATARAYVDSKGQPLFPGLVALGVSMIGAAALLGEWRRNQNRRRGVLVFFSLSLVLVAFVLSFGPQLIAGRALTPVSLIRLPYYWVSQVIPPLKSLNAPARFAVLVMLALALLAAFGAQRLAGVRPRRARLVGLVLCGVVLLEYASIPLPLTTVATAGTLSPVYSYLAGQPPGQPVVELPMGQPTFGDQDRYVVYTYNSIYHFQPLINGYSTFIPPEYYALVKDIQAFPSTASVRRLRDWGAVFVVVHSDRYKNADRLRASLDKLDGLVHIADYGEAWLYRVRK